MYSIQAHAKINIFLKITGFKDGYHTLISRFVRIDDLYDTIEFVPCKCDSFTIEGCDDIPLESNTIYKAYEVLLNSSSKIKEIKNFFKEHKVVVTKRIASQAGLGGGSSDAAAFMRLLNETCQLNINTDDLAELGSKVGADVPFFVYNYSSANVSGFGEMVMPFEEPALSVEIFTPDINCDTAAVYKTFNTYLLRNVDRTTFFGWENMDSRTLLNLIADPIVLNDLFPSALATYPQLEDVKKDGWFFSGSGSSFFRLKES
jgi:4-diphosphocytidyl-2-C-methyl-D-erythritol kinase